MRFNYVVKEEVPKAGTSGREIGGCRTLHEPLANERKNSCFYGSDKMANVSAAYHTLISTCKPMKASVSEYFSKVFAKIVRRCTDYSSMLPMNMGLSTDKYQMFNDNEIRG